MNSRQSIYQLRNLIRRDVGSKELAAILDLYPDAILLVDASSGFIRLGNSRATELTGYTKSELHGLDLRLVVQDFRTTKLEFFDPETESSRAFTTTISTRMGSPIPVEVRLEPIQSGGEWGLLIIEPVASQRKRQAEIAIQALRWDALRALIQSTRSLSMKSSFQMALEAGHNLTGAGILTIYILSGHVSNYIRYAAYGDTEALPEELEDVEHIHLQKPTIWTPGKITQTNLNRRAKTAGLKYLVTYPLIENNVLQGLLVMGDSETNPPDQIMQVTQIIADAATASLETKFLINNLYDRIGLNENRIEIGLELSRTINCGLILTTKSLKIQELNPAAEAKLGYQQQELEKIPIGNVLVGSKRLNEALEHVQLNLEPVELEDIVLHDRAGKEFPANLAISPVIEDKRLKSVLILIYDQTAQESLRRMNERLQPRAYIGDRLNEYSHDAKNQIAGIKAGLEVLTRRFANDEKNLAMINRIESETSKLERRLRFILETSTSGNYQMTPVNIADLIGNILNDMAYRLSRSKIQSELLAGPSVPPVYGDRAKLELVFENLITNAIQAMKETGGLLTIKVKEVRVPDTDEKKVDISVIDNGPGIPEEVVPLIFGQYYTTSDKRTGLGLSIVKRIISAHNGSIVPESFDGGTIFRILLPTPSGVTAARQNE